MSRRQSGCSCATRAQAMSRRSKPLRRPRRPAATTTLAPGSAWSVSGRRRRVGDAFDPQARAEQLRVLARGLLRQRAEGIELRVMGGDRRPQPGLVAAEVHVVLPDAHDRRPRVACDREVQAGARAHQHAVAHRADEAEQVDVGAGVEARIADVLGMDQPARALSRPALPRPRRPHVVGQRAQAHARVELERRPLAPAVRAHDFDLVPAGEPGRGQERRPDRASHRVGVRDQEPDDHARGD